jgi:hypothetical protein
VHHHEIKQNIQAAGLKDAGIDENVNTTMMIADSHGNSKRAE